MSTGIESPLTAADLIAWVQDSTARTLELVADLDDAQMLGPCLPIVNPLRWEIGHAAYFYEYWVLRHAARQAPVRPDSDALFDSIHIGHDERWDLPLPGGAGARVYVATVRDRVCEWLATGRPDGRGRFLAHYAVYHNDMHNEAFTYTRQTLGYPRPGLFAPGGPAAAPLAPSPIAGDAGIPGGTFLLGARGDVDFCFDNEKWAHPIEVRPFAIARAAVTQAEYAAFVDAGGYRRPEWWSPAGWRWREAAAAAHPVYWLPDGSGRWLRRDFDRWVVLEPRRPVLHVNWHEAEAYCRFARRRLPTEAEWECAANGGPGESRPYPWGDAAPDASRAVLDWTGLGAAPVDACGGGDTPQGVRQMLGNVWEWTATDFHAYPGFVPDHYAEYSQPLFGTTKVLRGGCFATRGRLIRNTWRNYYGPERRDVWAGFRTCAELRG